MCADILDSKAGVGSTWQDGAVENAWGKLEPILDAKLLRDRHLMGLALVSGMRDEKGKPVRVTDEQLKDQIDRAIERVETDLHCDITAVRRQEKKPFDKSEYEAFGFFRVKHRPIYNLIAVDVVPANNLSVYNVPLDWVETSLFAEGQINVIPLNIAIQNGGFIPSESAGGAIFLSILAQKTWIPSYWLIDYVSGFPDNMVPKIFNELIGTDAAIEVLSNLAATYARATSHSVGVDGLSQSVGSPGPQVYLQRRQDLQEQQKKLVKKLKTKLGLTWIIGNV